jgi:hypothetical protein
MGLYLNIVCDSGVSPNCVGDAAATGRYFSDARYFAREEGWIIKRGNITICPNCAWELEHPDETE